MGIPVDTRRTTGGGVPPPAVQPTGPAVPAGPPSGTNAASPYGSDGYGNSFGTANQQSLYQQAVAARNANLLGWQTDHDNAATNPNYYAGGSIDLNSGDFAGKTPGQLIQMFSQLGSNDPRKNQMSNALTAKFGANFGNGSMINQYNAGGTGYQNPQDYHNDYAMAYKWANGGGGGAPPAPGAGGGSPYAGNPPPPPAAPPVPGSGDAALTHMSGMNFDRGRGLGLMPNPPMNNNYGGMARGADPGAINTTGTTPDPQAYRYNGGKGATYRLNPTFGRRTY